MERLEEKILEYLKQCKCAKSFEILVKEFKIKSDDDKNLLKDCLKELEIKGILYENKNHNFILLEYDKSVLIGMVKMRDNGDAIVICGDQKINILSNNLEGVYNNDTVLVNNLCHWNKKIYGAVGKILKRKQSSIACVVTTNKNGEKELYPYLSDIKTKFNIDSKLLDDLVDGEIVLLDLNSLNNKKIVISKTEKYKDDPDNDIYALFHNQGIDVSYSEKYMKELKKIPVEVEQKSYNEGRIDLRNKNIFTLDGIHTKDFDDAVGIEKDENGNFIIYSCISDEPYYIKLDSVISDRACHLTSSIYLNNTVCHMFHPKISNGICSLNPLVDRLVRVKKITINKDGEIVDIVKFKGIINSKKRMTYEDVNEILENKKMIKGYEPFYESLKNLEIFSKSFEKKKRESGALNLLIPELEVYSSKENLKIEARTQKTAEKIIENVALLDNSIFAKDAFLFGMLIGYRVHEKPEPTKIKEFLDLLNNMGYKINVEGNLSSNKVIQTICEKIKFIDHHEIYYEMLLRCLKKAGYSVDNIGHFGLSLKEYAQNTSPIRRIIDFINMVNEDLFDNGEFDKLYDPEYIKYVEELTMRASEREKQFDKLDRDVNLMRMAEHMENHIGEQFEAIITNITKNKVIIKTNDNYIGQINFSDLTDDYYVYYEKTKSLFGRDKHISLKLGDKIIVKVKSASKINMTTNFTIIKKINSKQKVLQRA